MVLYIVGWELSPSRIGLPSVNQNQTHIHVPTPTLQPIGFNSLIDSQLEKAEKYAQNCVRCAYATMQVRFGCVCAALVYTYNPQALYFSKKFSPIFSTVVIFAIFSSFAAVAEIFAIKILHQ
jgi:hypothetical protein